MVVADLPHDEYVEDKNDDKRNDRVDYLPPTATR